MLFHSSLTNGFIQTFDLFTFQNDLRILKNILLNINSTISIFQLSEFKNSISFICSASVLTQNKKDISLLCDLFENKYKTISRIEYEKFIYNDDLNFFNNQEKLKNHFAFYLVHLNKRAYTENYFNAFFNPSFINNRKDTIKKLDK